MGTGRLVFDAVTTPWTSDADLRTRGGALVWDADLMGDGLPAPFRERFPAARPGTVLELPYRCLVKLPPARIGVGVALFDASDAAGFDSLMIGCETDQWGCADAVSAKAASAAMNNA